MRPSQRQPSELRTIRITRNFTRHAEGSVLIEMGDTRVLCTASVEESLPSFLRGDRRRFPPPISDFMSQLTHPERAAIGDFLGAAVIGGPETIHRGLTELLRSTAADELMLVCDIYDPDLRLRSLDIVSAVCKA